MTTIEQESVFNLARIHLIGNRRSQQDSIGSWESAAATFAVVADGAGGHAGGERASQTAIRVMEEAWSTKLCNGVTPEEAAQILREALLTAHNTIIAEAGGNAKICGKSAIVCLYLRNGHYTVAHAGDCRAYVADGTPWDKPITRDDSLVKLLIDIGEIDPSEERNHPDQNVLTQALGVDRELKPHVAGGTYSPSASFLLCSDGLWNQLPEELWEMKYWDVQNIQATLDKMGEESVKAANGRSDNASAIWLVPNGLTTLVPTALPTQSAATLTEEEPPATAQPVKIPVPTADTSTSCNCGLPFDKRHLALLGTGLATVVAACFLFRHVADEEIVKAPEVTAAITDATPPAEAAPTEPAPTEPAPTEPAPTESAPAEPAPTESAPTEPTPTEPTPTEPAPTEPAPTEPAATESAPAESAPAEDVEPAVLAKVEIADGVMLEITEDGIKEIYIIDEDLKDTPQTRIITVQTTGTSRKRSWKYFYTTDSNYGNTVYYHYTISH
ncbi:MAG: protein phosphatase 2C domain-containing protein [Akkermansia sp.]|nr:protein phosphatase 2C domain-containing protein [Akkermansia sp.]